MSNVIILLIYFFASYFLVFISNKANKINGDFLNLEWWQWIVIIIIMIVLEIMLRRI
jgi:hypothetical protein